MITNEEFIMDLENIFDSFCPQLNLSVQLSQNHRTVKIFVQQFNTDGGIMISDIFSIPSSAINSGPEGIQMFVDGLCLSLANQSENKAEALSTIYGKDKTEYYRYVNSFYDSIKSMFGIIPTMYSELYVDETTGDIL